MWQRSTNACQMNVVNQRPSDGHWIALCSVWLGESQSGGHRSNRAMEGIRPLVAEVLHPKCGGEADSGSVLFAHLKMLPVSGSERTENVRNPRVPRDPCFQGKQPQKAPFTSKMCL